MGKIKLYGTEGSPPCRACLLTLHALQVPFEFVQVNLGTGEHMTKEYLEKNPTNTVPTLDDNGVFIWDSHAIITYLARKFGKCGKLYPNDYLKRAIVDQRLHYESASIYTKAYTGIVGPLIRNNENGVKQQQIDNIVNVYNLLETFLQKNNYIAGEQLTVADFSIISTVTTLVGIVDIDADKYPKLTAWINRMKELPYYEEANGKGARGFVAMLQSKNIHVV